MPSRTAAGGAAAVCAAAAATAAAAASALATSPPPAPAPPSHGPMLSWRGALLDTEEMDRPCLLCLRVTALVALACVGAALQTSVGAALLSSLLSLLSLNSLLSDPCQAAALPLHQGRRGWHHNVRRATGRPRRRPLRRTSPTRPPPPAASSASACAARPPRPVPAAPMARPDPCAVSNTRCRRQR